MFPNQCRQGRIVARYQFSVSVRLIKHFLDHQGVGHPSDDARLQKKSVSCEELALVPFEITLIAG